jgi:hypothetical protein
VVRFTDGQHSDTSYRTSSDDDSYQEAIPKKAKKVSYVWDGLTRQDKNRIDPSLKPLISENQKVYLHCKASPYEWQEMLEGLDVFGPGQWLSEKVICRSLMDLWWPRRYGAQTGVAYLPFGVVQELSTAISKRGKEGSSDSRGFAQGPFYGQYSSVIPCLPCKRVGFVLIRNLGSMCSPDSSWAAPVQNPNHFFAIVFDYDLQRAHSFGAFCGSQVAVDDLSGNEGSWNKWYGPQLWRDIASLLGWGDTLQPFDQVRVVGKEWPQVMFPHANATAQVWTDRQLSERP